MNFMGQRLKDDVEEVINLQLDCGNEQGQNLTGYIAGRLGLKTSVGLSALRYALANAMLMDRKQQDYGPKNISSFGTFGVVVRMTDKFERLKTVLTKKGRRRTA